jgi:hypothetical protein
MPISNELPHLGGVLKLGFTSSFMPILEADRASREEDVWLRLEKLSNSFGSKF